jgi:hypothetical protein
MGSCCLQQSRSKETDTTAVSRACRAREHYHCHTFWTQHHPRVPDEGPGVAYSNRTARKETDAAVVSRTCQHSFLRAQHCLSHILNKPPGRPDKGGGVACSIQTAKRETGITPVSRAVRARAVPVTPFSIPTPPRKPRRMHWFCLQKSGRLWATARRETDITAVSRAFCMHEHCPSHSPLPGRPSEKAGVACSIQTTKVRQTPATVSNNLAMTAVTTTSRTPKHLVQHKPHARTHLHAACQPCQLHAHLAVHWQLALHNIAATLTPPASCPPPTQILASQLRPGCTALHCTSQTHQKAHTPAETKPVCETNHCQPPTFRRHSLTCGCCAIGVPLLLLSSLPSTT